MLEDPVTLSIVFTGATDRHEGPLEGNETVGRDTVCAFHLKNRNGTRHCRVRRALQARVSHRGGLGISDTEVAEPHLFDTSVERRGHPTSATGTTGTSSATRATRATYTSGATRASYSTGATRAADTTRAADAASAAAPTHQ